MIGQLVTRDRKPQLIATLEDDGRWSSPDPVAAADLERLFSIDTGSVSDGVPGHFSLRNASVWLECNVSYQARPEAFDKTDGLVNGDLAIKEDALTDV